MTERRGESLESMAIQTQAFDRRKPEGAGGWATRTNCSEHGDRSDPWLCSRVVWVAEVDEQRLVPDAAPRKQRDNRGLAGRLSPHKNERKLRGEAALEPDRSGESHEHASSETGGLPVILCVVRERRRWRGAWRGGCSR